MRLQNPTSRRRVAPTGSELTVTFRRGDDRRPDRERQRTLSFWITDIDAITTNPYSDRVELQPGPFNQARDANITRRGPTWHGSHNNVGPGAPPRHNSNVGENAAGARVQVSVRRGDISSRSRLTYWNATSPGIQYHRIFLSDFVFTSTGC